MPFAPLQLQPRRRYQSIQKITPNKLYSMTGVQGSSFWPTITRKERQTGSERSDPEVGKALGLACVAPCQPDHHNEYGKPAHHPRDEARIVAELAREPLHNGKRAGVELPGSSKGYQSLRNLPRGSEEREAACDDERARKHGTLQTDPPNDKGYQHKGAQFREHGQAETNRRQVVPAPHDEER